MNGCIFKRVISSPWMRVRTMATAMIATTAGTTPKPHSVSIIDIKTPNKAIIEPTESSMPPVMMTRPRPILKMPNEPICRARFCRLIASRKFGFLMETMMQRTTSKMKMPSSFFISELSFCTSSQTHNCFFAELSAFENAGQLSFMQDGDAIANTENLFHLAADDDNGYTLLGQFSD